MFTSPLISQLDNHHHRRHFIFLFNKFRCPVGQRINKVTLKNMAASMEGTWEEVLSSIDNLLMETEIQKMRAHCSISVIQNIECFQFVWKNRIFRKEKKCNCSFFRCKLKKREKLSETFLFSRFLPESLEYHGTICFITSFMLMAAFCFTEKSYYSIHLLLVFAMESSPVKRYILRPLHFVSFFHTNGKGKKGKREKNHIY